MVSEDLRGVSHHRLDERDKTLRKMQSELNKKFLFHRLLNRVSIDRTCISKGYHVSSSWVSRITVSNLTKTQAESVQSIVEDNEDIRVAISLWKQEDGTYLVEVT